MRVHLPCGATVTARASALPLPVRQCVEQALKGPRAVPGLFVSSAPCEIDESLLPLVRSLDSLFFRGMSDEELRIWAEGELAVPTLSAGPQGWELLATY